MIGYFLINFTISFWIQNSYFTIVTWNQDSHIVSSPCIPTPPLLSAADSSLPFQSNRNASPALEWCSLSSSSSFLKLWNPYSRFLSWNELHWEFLWHTPSGNSFQGKQNSGIFFPQLSFSSFFLFPLRLLFLWIKKEKLNSCVYSSFKYYTLCNGLISFYYWILQWHCTVELRVFIYYL